MQFEYKVVLRPANQAFSESGLNALGSEGWELVSTSVYNNIREYVFKRVLPQYEVLPVMESGIFSPEEVARMRDVILNDILNEEAAR